MIALFAFLSALALSYAGTRLLLARPPRNGFVDVPNARSSHDRPKPRYGGIAIVSAFILVFAGLCIARPEFRTLLPVLGGVAVLFGIGLMDDWRGVGVGARFIAQGAAAAMAIASGLVIDQIGLPVAGTVQLGVLAVPVTALVIVASINFYNFIDGIDGLAAGSAFIAAAFLAIVGFMVGQPVLAVVFLAVAGAAIGFLQFNFPPSRLFMGDSGSTFFGYVFACLAIAGNRARPEIPLFVPLLLLSSLYLDAALTIVNRLMKNEKVLQPHRTHYYQRLLQIGLNHKQVTLLEYLVTILLGASALLYVRAGQWFAPFLAVTWVLAFTLSILKIRGLERGDRLIWERRTLFVVATDLMAIALAFMGAYFVRMNFQFTEVEGRAVLRVLPIVVIVRSACFFKFGLYRSMWRYTTTNDVVRVIKAVTVGSGIILAAVVLLYRFVAFPRSLFVLEYFLLISFILGVRFSTRLFHEIGRESQGGEVRRYAVIGSGDAAERAAREINARGPGHGVVCFVDDDAATIGLSIHGVPVEGPGDRLADIAGRHRLDVLVYALEGAGEAAAARWVDRARGARLPIDAVSGGLDSALPDAIAMDRVALALGRRTNVSARALGGLHGRKVLVTHGGGPFAGALVAGLRHAGALPLLQVDTGHPGVGDVAFCAGALHENAAQFVRGFMPDVVIHVLDIEPSGAINDEDSGWNRVVRDSEALARAVWSARPGCRIVVASLWNATRPGDRAAAVAAVMETMVLARAGTESLAVLRLPRVLTSPVLAATRESAGAFDLLESEAVRQLLELAAGGFRGIYVPAAAREFPLALARAALRGSDIIPASAATPGRLALFASEHIDECGVDGVRRVLGPLFPATYPFRRWGEEGPVESSPAARAEWLRAVGEQLDQPSARGERVLD
ncbi:MAG TPA: hypothetical protein VFX92_02650 [Candidatus Krumholzibacteria bacterium]|nr:hypothetical protein [Candidatus Krumholzibacteria bacterium]